MKNDKITFLDGSDKEQKKTVNDYLGTLSEEEHKRAMSSEFDYLEDDSEDYKKSE